MDTPTKVQGGLANCYLNSAQMRALLALVADRGVVRGQLVKEAVVRLLVAEGKLPETEITAMQIGQKRLADKPHPNARFRYAGADYGQPMEDPEKERLRVAIKDLRESERGLETTNWEKAERLERIDRRRERRRLRARKQAQTE